MFAAPLQRCTATSPAKAPVQRKPAAAEPARGDSARMSELIEKSHSRAPAMVQAKYAVSSTGDRHEREADSAADSAVAGRSAPSLSPVSSSVQRSTNTAPQRSGAGDPVGNALARPPPGQALQRSLRKQLEGSYSADLRGVRVHTGPEAESAAAHINARAFTSGHNVWLGAGESPADTRLMAHEVAHVVQQGAAPRTNSATGPTGTSPPSGPAKVQRSGLGDIFSIDTVWSVLRRVAPSFEPVVREIYDLGIFGYLKKKLGSAMRGILGGMRNEGGGLAVIADLFTNLGAMGAEILGGLSNGCCEPLFAALSRMKNAVSDMAGRAWDKVADFFRPVGEFFSGLWDKFNSGVIGPIAELLGDAWEWIKGLGRTLWGYVEPIKDAAFGLGGQVWDWIKDTLGIGSGEGSSEGGLMQWITSKISAVWTEIKTELAPVLAPIRRAVEFVQSLLPMEAIQRLRERVQTWMTSLSQTANAMQQDDGVVANQGTLRDTILPAIIESIGGLKTRITEAGAWVSEKFGGIATSIGGLLTSLGQNTWLSWAEGALSWLREKVDQLAAFASGAVSTVLGWITDALGLLQRWIQPIFDTLVQLITVVSDIAGRIGSFVTGRLFGWIPVCIRNPIKEFLITQVLGRIPIFSQLIAIPNLWERLSRTAMSILTKIFVHGNLAAAAWEFFSKMLELVGIPPGLVVGIIAKAASAIGEILRDPVGFLMNVLRTMKRGFERFFENIGRHLLNGVAGWLFGHLEGAGITIPPDFSLRSILGLVMQVLGITIEKVIQKVELHAGARVGQRLRQMVRVATGVWRFAAILIEEGPAGLWREVQQQLSNLWAMVRDGAINWITTTIVQQVTIRLLSMLDPTGIMAVVNSLLALWAAIETFMQYARQVLEMVNRVLDGINQIAQGVIETGAGFLEDALARAIPIAIGFLANFLRFGNIGQRIRSIIERVQTAVDGALDSLILRAVRMGRAFLDMLKSGARAVASAIRNWWEAKKDFTVEGQPHKVYVQGSGASARLMVASTPTNYAEYIENMAHGRGADAGDIDKAKKKAVQIDTAIANARANPDPAAPQAHADIINALLEELSVVTTRIMTKDALKEGTPPIYGGCIHGFGTSVNVEQLRKVSYGSGPSKDDGHWQILRKRMNGGTTYYIRGHLLNDNLGGPGNTWDNLTPLTQEANNRASDSMLHMFEKQVKTEVKEKRKTVSFTVTANYSAWPDRTNEINDLKKGGDEDQEIAAIMEAERFIPQTLGCVSHELNTDGTRGAKVANLTVRNHVGLCAYSVSPNAKTKVVINSATDAQLLSLCGNVVSLRDTFKAGRPYRTYSDAEAQMGASAWSAARSAFNVKLYER